MATRLRQHPSIVDDDRTWSIAMDVADFRPSELRVEVDCERLSVAAERPAIGPYELHGHLDEAMHLPPGLEPEQARAFFDDGILRIEVPKRPPAHRVIPVERNGPRVNADAAPC